jgi:hypothetical protein
MIAWLIGKTGIPGWILEVIMIGLVALAVHLWEHHLIDEGVSEQQHRDDQALQQLKDAATQVTEQLKQRAEAAEAAYAKERADSIAYQGQHPITTARELCHDTHGGSADLPEAHPAQPGDAPPGTPAQPLQSVPAGDPTVSLDRLAMLQALGASADQVSSQLREYQRHYP